MFFCRAALVLALLPFPAPILPCAVSDGQHVAPASARMAGWVQGARGSTTRIVGSAFILCRPIKRLGWTRSREGEDS